MAVLNRPLHPLAPVRAAHRGPGNLGSPLAGVPVCDENGPRSASLCPSLDVPASSSWRSMAIMNSDLLQSLGRDKPGRGAPPRTAPRQPQSKAKAVPQGSAGTFKHPPTPQAVLPKVPRQQASDLPIPTNAAAAPPPAAGPTQAQLAARAKNAIPNVFHAKPKSAPVQVRAKAKPGHPSPQPLWPSLSTSATENDADSCPAIRRYRPARDSRRGLLRPLLLSPKRHARCAHRFHQHPAQ